MESKGIIGLIYDQEGDKRYQIKNEYYKKFIEDIWMNLFSNIEARTTLKWYYIKRPDPIELRKDG